MRKGPRTCEYYYVISDAKTHSAVGIASTPDRFEVIHPGEAHERLPEPVADAVLMSAGDRYKKLVERVRAGYGKIDAAAARDLMRRPVAMSSNIHAVLFAPDTLDILGGQRRFRQRGEPHPLYTLQPGRNAQAIGRRRAVACRLGAETSGGLFRVTFLLEWSSMRMKAKGARRPGSGVEPRTARR